VWGSNKETVSTTAYPSTLDWEVIISTQDNTIALYLHVIELSNVKTLKHIAISKDQKGILSLKEVQVFSKKSEFLIILHKN